MSLRCVSSRSKTRFTRSIYSFGTLAPPCARQADDHEGLCRLLRRQQVSLFFCLFLVGVVPDLKLGTGSRTSRTAVRLSQPLADNFAVLTRRTQSRPAAGSTSATPVSETSLARPSASRRPPASRTCQSLKACSSTSTARRSRSGGLRSSRATRSASRVILR